MEISPRSGERGWGVERSAGNATSGVGPPQGTTTGCLAVRVDTKICNNFLRPPESIIEPDAISPTSTPEPLPPGVCCPKYSTSWKILKSGSRFIRLKIISQCCSSGPSPS